MINIRKIRDYFQRIFGSRKKTETPKITTHPIQIELSRTIARARDEAKGAHDISQKVGENLQSVIDEANVTIPLVPYMDPEDVEGLITIWSSAADQASNIKAGLEEIYPSTDSSSSTASISSAIISGSYSSGRLFIDEDFTVAWIPFLEFAGRPSLRREVTRLLKEYGFNVSQFPGEKSPLEQFEIAHDAFGNPVTVNNPVSTSLIPLRECIQSIVDSLMSMRPIREETGHNQRKKILSIGMQLKKGSLPEEVVLEWADQWDDLSKSGLSGSKRKEITREDWLNRLNRGTSFLHSLLKGLDVDKLKR